MGKRGFFHNSYVNKPSRCHNPQKAWTPQQPFRGKRLNPEILYQILNLFHSFGARTANARPPSVLLLNRGHIKFILQKRVDLLLLSIIIIIIIIIIIYYYYLLLLSIRRRDMFINL